jgi:MFS family permease
MTQPVSTPIARAGHVSYSDTHKRKVIVLMMLAYTFNSAHRTLIAIIGQPMKVDLNLTDTQLGLLVGTAFAALYAFSGIPIARLAERFNRVTIMSVALTIWSGLTILCGAATSFAQLLVFRVGVGVGEAGCSPAAHSLICDYVEPARRSTALSIYSCGISLGYILSAVVGGYVALHYGWRSACVVLGLPGIAVAIVIKRLVDEPPRGNSEPPLDQRGAGADPVAEAPPLRNDRRFWLWAELAELGAVARELLLRWPVGNVVIGVTVASFASQGAWAFVPAFFTRAFRLDYATTGIVVALAGGVAVGFGLLAGGFVTDLLGARRAKWYALVPAIGLAVCVPLYALAFLLSDWRSTALILGVAGFFQYLSFGPTFGIVQNAVGGRRRATATALIYVLLNVIALGGGPPFTGWMIDRFAEFNFAHREASTVRASFAAMSSTPSGGLSAFRRQCSGGRAAASIDPTVRTACETTLALASRQGILITVLLYAWAALHYLLGAIGLEKALRSAVLKKATRAGSR